MLAGWLYSGIININIMPINKLIFQHQNYLYQGQSSHSSITTVHLHPSPSYLPHPSPIYPPWHRVIIYTLMSVRSIAVEDTDMRTSRSDALEPIIIKFPITEDDELIALPRIEQAEVARTIGKLRSINRGVPLQVILKGLLLLVLGLILFYAMLIAIAVMLFNIVLAFVCLLVFANYLKWACLSLAHLRHQVGQRRTKRFLEAENRRLYSSKLFRFQLVEYENCIKILNLRFSE